MKFEIAELEVVEFAVEDVITTSDNNRLPEYDV